MRLKEKIIIKNIKKNNTDSFADVYDKYVERVYRFIFFKVPTEEIAQDISHEVFTDLLDGLLNKDTQQIKSLQAFIYQIARNKIADYYRLNNNQNQIFELDENIKVDNQQLETKTDLEKSFDQKREVDNLMKAIRQIKNQDYQEIILLKHVEGLSFKEIEKIMDKKASNLRVLLHRALKELKNIINSVE